MRSFEHGLYDVSKNNSAEHAVTEAMLQASSPKLTPMRILILAILAAIYWAAIQGTEISLNEIVTGMPAIAELLSEMFPPDWSYLGELFPRVIETLQIGIIATIIASILSLPLAFLAAKNVSPHPLIYIPIRFSSRSVGGIGTDLGSIVCGGCRTWPVCRCHRADHLLRRRDRQAPRRSR